MQINKIKRWLAPLRGTPLHPQWLIREPLVAADLAEFHGTTLDVGCAGGGVARLLPTDGHYIGLDYYQTATGWYHTRPDLYGDAHELPLADGSVDNALMLHVLEHLALPGVALNETHRVMRPGGRLLVEVPFLYPLHDAPLDFHRWTGFGLASDLEAAGFEVLGTRCFGQPAESAAMLFNLAVGRLALDWLERRSPWLLLAPLTVPLIPLLNLLGRGLGALSRRAEFMPQRVQVLCRKPDEQARDTA